MPQNVSAGNARLRTAVSLALTAGVLLWTVIRLSRVIDALLETTSSMRSGAGRRALAGLFFFAAAVLMTGAEARMADDFAGSNLSSWPVDGFGQALFEALEGVSLTQCKQWDALSPAEVEAYDDAADALLDAYRSRQEPAKGGWAGVDVTVAMMDAGFAAIRHCWGRQLNAHVIARSDMRNIFRAMIAERERAAAVTAETARALAPALADPSSIPGRSGVP